MCSWNIQIDFTQLPDTESQQKGPAHFTSRMLTLLCLKQCNNGNGPKRSSHSIHIWIRCGKCKQISPWNGTSMFPFLYKKNDSTPIHDVLRIHCIKKYPFSELQTEIFSIQNKWRKNSIERSELYIRKSNFSDFFQ